MTRSELLTELKKIENTLEVQRLNLTQLIEQIDDDGVLDVQAPPEIAESMNLPRPG